MILCICNNIREQDIKRQPELANLIGSCCGRCLINQEVATIKSGFYDATKKKFVEA
jgi:bacterioferritin-associated ferredoxin